MRKLFASLSALALVGAGMILSAGSAEADPFGYGPYGYYHHGYGGYYDGYYHHHHHGYGGNTIGAGLLGLGVGALIGGALASANSAPAYGYDSAYRGYGYREYETYRPVPVVVVPRPIYRVPQPVYAVPVYRAPVRVVYPAARTYGTRAAIRAHAAACAAHYHSYDPATDTFLGYDGRRHRCTTY